MNGTDLRTYRSKNTAMLITLLRDGIAFYSITFCVLLAAVVVGNFFPYYIVTHNLSDLGLLESVLQLPAHIHDMVYKYYVDLAFSPFS